MRQYNTNNNIIYNLSLHYARIQLIYFYFF